MVIPQEISIKDLLKYSPHYFIEKVFNYRMDGIHNQMLNHMIDHPFSLTLAPRSHGKSKVLQGYITFLIVNDPNIRILLISDTDRKSQLFLGTIKNVIETSPVLEKYYGNLVGNRWSAHQLSIRGRTTIHTEPSLLAAGAGSGTVTGLHAERIFLDDLVSFDSSRSQLHRERDKDWFLTTLSPCLVAGGKITAAGTRYHYLDMYDMLINRLKYNTMILPAIQDNGTSLCEWLQPLEDILNEDGEIIKKGLKTIRTELGPIIFGLQFMNDVSLLMKGNIFDLSWLQQRYDSVSIEDKIYIIKNGKKIKLKKIYLGCDLAISEKDTADYTVISAVGKGVDGNIYILEVNRSHSTFDQQLKTITYMSEKWGVDGTIVESTSYQESMVQELRRVSGIKVQGIKPTRDKVSRANSITGYFEAGLVYFRKNMEDAITELLLFPDGEKDDQVDSLVYAMLGFKSPKSNLVVMKM